MGGIRREKRGVLVFSSYAVGCQEKLMNKKQHFKYII